jgi:cytochrome c oxidase subunit 2
MAFAIIIALLVIGSVIFHAWSPWWLTPIASNWGSIDTTIDITVWVTGFAFVAINLFLAYTVYKYRYSKDRRAEYEPENKKLEVWLTAITSVGVAALLAPGLFVWADFVNPPEEAHEVEVTGQQWQWAFRYPGADGKLGAADPGLITEANPFGMKEDDPAGRDDILVESSVMHLPVDKPVKVLLRSKDVLHDFAVAEFRVKMDMVPGAVSYLWLTPTKTGTYDILCEELCGVGHFVMRGKVKVQEQADFDQWLASQNTYDDTLALAKVDRANGQATYAMCAGCHGVQGEGNPALNSPQIAGLQDWYLTAQLEHFKQGIRGSSPSDTYGAQMVGLAAALPDDRTIRNLSAYINSLPTQKTEQTLDGNQKNGKELYDHNCSVCHGDNGRGVWSVHAPKLAGMNDWYVARQLRHFRDKVRGAHPEDDLGHQMQLMVSVLADDAAINDVASYISSMDPRSSNYMASAESK